LATAIRKVKPNAKPAPAIIGEIKFSMPSVMEVQHMNITGTLQKRL
jgi:hypothetical protein